MNMQNTHTYTPVHFYEVFIVTPQINHSNGEWIKYDLPIYTILLSTIKEPFIALRGRRPYTV